MKLRKFVHKETTRHGETCYYFRRGHGLRIRLPDPDSANFDEVYAEALNNPHFAPDLRPNSPPAIGRIRRLVFAVIRLFSQEPFSWRIRWA